MSKPRLKNGRQPTDRRLIKLEKLFHRDDAYACYWSFDVVRRALWAANSDKPITNNLLKRKLRVLPPRSIYYIDPHGGYLGGPKAIAKDDLKERPQLVKRATVFLTDEMKRIVAGKDRRRGRMVPVGTDTGGARIVELEGGPPNSEWWIKANYYRDKVGDQFVCTPTYEDFVVHAVTVLRSTPWKTMLRQCASPECDKFFLTPKKRQRPFVTCPGSDTCKQDRINHLEISRG